MPEANKKEDPEQLDLIDDNKKEEVVIEIEKDAPKGPTPEETIESLKAQIAEKDRILATERDRATKAETEKQTASQTAATATQSAWQMRETAVENSITAEKSNLENIKKQLKTARSSGDIDGEIELEEKLADSKYQLNASLWEKKNIEAQKVENEKRAKIESVQPKTGSGFSTRSQEWINSHPRFNTDEEYQAQTYASHTLAIKKGYQPDTDAYFEFVNNRLAKVMAEDADETIPVKQSQVASTAAPPSRSATTQRSGTNGKTIRLTSDQLDAAEACGMTPAEYAADLMKIEEEKRRQ